MLFAATISAARRIPPQKQCDGMSKKTERQTAILRLVGRHSIASQEDLKRLLAADGFVVTQATLSRDLHELGVLRAPTDDGARYLLPQMLGDSDKPRLDRLLPQWFLRIDGVGEIIVLHTLPSGAPPISEAVDSQAWPEVIGTLAGENTVLIVCRSATDRATVTQRLTELAAAG